MEVGGRVESQERATRSLVLAIGLALLLVVVLLYLALDSVLEFEGPDRAHFLLDELFTEARRKGTPVPYSGTTPYLNTIAPDREPRDVFCYFDNTDVKLRAPFDAQALTKKLAPRRSKP